MTAKHLGELTNTQIREEVRGLRDVGLKHIREVIPNPNADVMPEMVPQPHGGALLSRGMQGNRGGRKPPSEVRKASRAAYDELVPRLLKMGLGEGTIRLQGECENCGHKGEPITMDDVQAAIVGPKEQIRAADVLGKYGLGQAKGVDREDLIEYVKMLGGAVQEVLVEELGDDEAEDVCKKVFDGWRRIAHAHLT